MESACRCDWRLVHLVGAGGDEQANSIRRVESVAGGFGEDAPGEWRGLAGSRRSWWRAGRAGGEQRGSRGGEGRWKRASVQICSERIFVFRGGDKLKPVDGVDTKGAMMMRIAGWAPARVNSGTQVFKVFSEAVGRWW